MSNVQSVQSRIIPELSDEEKEAKKKWVESLSNAILGKMLVLFEYKKQTVLCLAINCKREVFNSLE